MNTPKRDDRTRLLVDWRVFEALQSWKRSAGARRKAGRRVHRSERTLLDLLESDEFVLDVLPREHRVLRDEKPRPQGGREAVAGFLGGLVGALAGETLLDAVAPGRRRSSFDLIPPAPPPAQRVDIWPTPGRGTTASPVPQLPSSGSVAVPEFCGRCGNQITDNPNHTCHVPSL